jgi:hypothetical protein
VRRSDDPSVADPVSDLLRSKIYHRRPDNWFRQLRISYAEVRNPDLSFGRILEQSDRSQGNHEGRGRRKHHGSVKRSLKNFVCSVLVSDKVIRQFAG